MSRGEVIVIVEEDLAEALKNREIFAAGVDVLKTEPISKYSPLLKEERIIITPHTASWTPEAFNKVLCAVLQDQLKVFNCEEPFFIVK